MEQSPARTVARGSRASDGGFFKAAGIDVTFVGGNNGQAIAAGVAGGAIDIGMSNTVSLVQARANGLPFI